MTAEGRKIAVEAEVRKSRSAVQAAQHLRTAGIHDDAMSRLYYAAYHSAAAARAALGIDATSHRALSTLFSLHAVNPGHAKANRAASRRASP